MKTNMQLEMWKKKIEKMPMKKIRFIPALSYIKLLI